MVGFSLYVSKVARSVLAARSISRDRIVGLYPLLDRSSFSFSVWDQKSVMFVHILRKRVAWLYAIEFFVLSGWYDFECKGASIKYFGHS